MSSEQDTHQALTEKLDAAETALAANGRTLATMHTNLETVTSELTVAQLRGLSMVEVRDRCRSEGLGTKGTRKAMLSRLEPLAADTEVWTREWFTAHVVQSRGGGPEDFGASRGGNPGSFVPKEEGN